MLSIEISSYGELIHVFEKFLCLLEPADRLSGELAELWAGDSFALFRFHRVVRMGIGSFRLS